MHYCAKARSKDDSLIHGTSIKILFITPACTDSIPSANATDFTLMNIAKICRPDKEFDYEMRRGTKFMKRKAQLCIGVWSRSNIAGLQRGQLVSVLTHTTQFQEPEVGAKSFTISRRDSSGSFLGCFSRKIRGKQEAGQHRDSSLHFPLLGYGQRQTMSGEQAGLAVFREIAGEVRGTLGYVERLIGNTRTSRKICEFP